MHALERLIHDISYAYGRDIVDAHKQPQAFMLISFLVTFIVARFITHSIRANRFHRVFHNLSTKGGTHLHHLVPGIMLLLISGYLGIGMFPWIHRELVAVLFGIGAALMLDEFALWLHLQDDYWSKQGRQSVDAVIVAATLAGLTIVGSRFWTDVAHAVGRLFGLG